MRWTGQFRPMKLEILKENKTTKAKPGTIMLVAREVGEQWCQKGWALDLSNPDWTPEEDIVVDTGMIEEEPAPEPNNDND